MNPFWGLFILAGIIYGLFIDGTFWKIYMVLVIAYYGFTMWYRDPRTNILRKTIMISTWGGKSKFQQLDINSPKFTLLI